MVALINTPGLARLRVTFDAKTSRLHISSETAALVDEVLNPEGRRRISAVLADYVLKLDENPLTAHPERLPLRDRRRPFTALPRRTGRSGHIAQSGKSSIA